MKLSKYLVGTLACALVAGCANEDVQESVQTGSSGEEAYIAVRLMAPNMASRAFQDGDDTAGESDVTSARFYFFNNTGDAVTVSDAGNYVTSTSPTLSWTDNTNDNQNEDEHSNVVLVLQGENNAQPTKMVVVLNPPSSLGNGSKSLAQLSAAADYSVATKGNFVMSNSVYNDNTTKIDAVNIAANLAETADAATENPINVYVERVVARVDVKQNNTSLNNYSDDTEVDASEINGQTTPTNDAVIAVVKGWGIANKNATSYLIKNVGTDTNSPFSWNDLTNHRSYWAITTELNNNLATNPSYADMTPATGVQIPTTQYCQERTGITDISGNPTELVVIAELQVDGVATTIARYAGQYYTVDALLDQFLTQLPDIYIKTTTAGATENDPDTWTKLDKTYLKLRPAEAGETGVAAYEAVLDLKDAYTNTTNYEFASNSDGTSSLTLENVLTDLNALKAQLWYNGRTYYHVPITHDIDGETATDPGRYGVVRNHLYSIAVTGISGLGTPIPDDTEDPDEEDPEDPIDPEDPEDNNSYLATQIYMLSWNVITQSAELGK